MIVPHMEQIDPSDLLVFARVVAEGSLTAAATGDRFVVSARIPAHAGVAA